MRLDKNSLKLYAVTDRKWLKGSSLEEEVEKAVRAGVTMVQLREKHMEFAELVTLAKKIGAVVHKYNIPLIINDDIEAALASGADGVHVGQEDICASEARQRIGSSMILGVSARSAETAIEAERCGADYIGAGAVFSTSTKEDAKIMSFDELKRICDSVSIPVVAIGGITEENIMELSGSGIAGAAVVSAIFAKEDVMVSSARLLTLIEKMLSSK
ncbi:MAG: thiamine phosphate synthase [Synergistaceae bacterium]|nr:thiamine phosphate synthase [Synergistaceae bacterium]MBP9559364.1 thiamine phosphate synthase [Synergistaceae bacterium]MBP9975552.1 thiamine phosphate synthase [Synergistaceae bacterium]